MENKINNNISRITQLMKYDRSKTLLEQSQGEQVNKDETNITPSEINIGKNDDPYGKEFNYPNNCKYPKQTLQGTLEQPVIKGYCIYRSPKPGGYVTEENEIYKIYLPENATISFHDSEDDLAVIMEPIESKYKETRDESWYDSIYNSLERIFPITSPAIVRSFKTQKGVSNTVIGRNDENLWFFKGYTNYTEPKINVVSDPYIDVISDIKDMSKASVDLVSSFLCGDKSIFKGGRIPILDYRTEEFACDVVASLLMYMGPIGLAAGATIEFAHAKDLMNKGDMVGAYISITIGLIPIIGDAASIALKSLVKKVGFNSVVKVISCFVNYIKFLNGELKATVILDAIRNLTKDERRLLFLLHSTSNEVLRVINGLPKYLDEAIEYINELGLSGLWFDESIKNILNVIRKSSFVRGVLNVSAQMGGMLTSIFGTQTIVSLGYDPNSQDTEELLRLCEKLVDNPSVFEVSEEQQQIYFKEKYPCVTDHPNVKMIKVSRQDSKTLKSKNPEIAYEIDGKVFFIDGIYNEKETQKEGSYDCNSEFFK